MDLSYGSACYCSGRNLLDCLQRSPPGFAPRIFYPAGINWDVVTQGIQYADVNPNSESFMPSYNKSLDVLVKYLTRWTSTGGLNMDTEFANLKSELQKVWDAAK